MEAVFMLFFIQWYISRYYHLGVQLPFGVMVALILGLWGVILGVGLWRDKRSTSQSGRVENHSTSQSDSADQRSTIAPPGGDPVDKSRA